MPMIPLSVLDLVPVCADTSASHALRDTVHLARFVESLGFVRYWFAEHHGMGAIASSSPEVLIGHVAGATTRIRVGSGGVMLPNHAPLRIAEAFHTLEALYPGRIDLGLGRAPGTDPATSRALRPFSGDTFPDQLNELLALSRHAFPDGHPFASVRVVPTDVALPPVWVLASSGATAAYAGSIGVGYGFARHFSPNPPGPALEAYRRSFRPSTQLSAPHVILGVSVMCAPTHEEADYLTRSSDLGWIRLHRGEFAPLPSPDEATAYQYSEAEQAVVAMNRRRHFIGTPAQVVAALSSLASDTRPDEIMVTSNIHGRAERFRSYELLVHEWANRGVALPTSS